MTKKYNIMGELRTNVSTMSNPKKKPAKKSPAKKATAKKAVAKKPAKKAPAKKEVAKKTPAKNTSPKRKAPVVNVVTQTAKTSATPSEISVNIVASGAIPETVTHTINNIVHANDVKTASLRKRMLRWFTKK